MVDAISSIPAGDRFAPAAERNPRARAETIDHPNPQTTIRLLLANEVVQDEIVSGHGFTNPELREVFDRAPHRIGMAMSPEIIQQAAGNESVVIPAHLRQQSTAEIGFNPTMITRHMGPDGLVTMTFHPLSRHPFAIVLVEVADRLPKSLMPRRRSIQIGGQLLGQGKLDAEIGMIGMEVTRPFASPGERLPPPQSHETVAWFSFQSRISYR